MALDDIFNALDEQADKEIEQILTDARDQAEAIAQEASDKAVAQRQAAADVTDKATRERASRSVNAARLASKKSLASVKEDALSETFESAKAKLSTARSDPGYDATFAALAKEALEGVGDEIEALVDEADVALADRTMAELGVSAQIKPEIQTSGGLVIRTGGGRILRRNTLEDRLEKAQGLIQADVAEILFP